MSISCTELLSLDYLNEHKLYRVIVLGTLNVHKLYRVIVIGLSEIAFFDHINTLAATILYLILLYFSISVNAGYLQFKLYLLVLINIYFAWFYFQIHPSSYHSLMLQK